MRTLFGQANGETLNYPDFSRVIEHIGHDTTPQKERQIGTSFVQLEIHSEALKRLIVQHRLAIEEIHCTNRQAKEIIRQALLNTLINTPS